MAVFTRRRTVPGEVVPGSSSYAFSDRFEKRALTFLSPPVGAAAVLHAIVDNTRRDSSGSTNGRLRRRARAWALPSPGERRNHC